MSHSPSKTDIDRRAEQLNPVSPQYYRDRGYEPQSAAELASLAQRRFQIEASHQKQTQKRKCD